MPARVLLDIAQLEGNFLKESWKDILLCISQLDRLQLISTGVDANSVPDVSKARFLAVTPTIADTNAHLAQNPDATRPSSRHNNSSSRPSSFQQGPKHSRVRSRSGRSTR